MVKFAFRTGEYEKIPCVWEKKKKKKKTTTPDLQLCVYFVSPYLRFFFAVTCLLPFC